jgi:hypothetical protein
MLINIFVTLVKEIIGYNDLHASCSDVSDVDGNTEVAMT